MKNQTCEDGFHSFVPLVEMRDDRGDSMTLARRCEACEMVVDDEARLRQVERWVADEKNKQMAVTPGL